MPQLSKQETVRLYLPSTAGLPSDERAWVDLRHSLTVGDIEAANAGDAQTRPMAATVSLVASLIASWNFTDGDGRPVPVSEESVRRMEVADFKAVSEELGRRLSADIPKEDAKK